VKLSKQGIADAGIRIIGIKGQSCSGKSEAADIIRAYFKNAIVLRADFHLFKAAADNDDLAMRVYGRTFDNVHEVLAHFMKIESIDLIERNGVLTAQCVEKMLLRDIKSLLKQNFIPNPIIIESSFLGLYPQICDLITDMLFVWAPKDVLAKNQMAREGKDTVEIRTTALPLSMYTSGKQGKIILNTGSLPEFKSKITDYCDFIKIASNKNF